MSALASYYTFHSPICDIWHICYFVYLTLQRRFFCSTLFSYMTAAQLGPRLFILENNLPMLYNIDGARGE